MAKQMDDFSDLGAEPVDDFADLGAEPIEEASTSSSPMSKTESALEGAKAGLTFGFADEAEGGVGAAMDAGQQLLNKLGLTGPSVSQVNEQLASQGFKGDVGPTDTEGLYKEFRDASRAKATQAQEDNPMSFFAGNLAAVAALPLGALNAAKGAPLLTQMGRGAAVGAGMGALTGAGTSDADLLEGDVAGLGTDVAGGATMGAALGGAIPAAIGGIKGGAKLIGESIPETSKQAFKRGLEGINTTSKEFYDDVTKKLGLQSKKIAEPINEAVEKNAKEIASLESQQMKIQDDIKQQVERGQARAQIQSASDITKQQKNELQMAQKIQDRIATLRKRLGSNYDKIDKAAEKLNIYPDTRAPLSSMIEEIQTNSALPEGTVAGLMKKIQPMLDGQADKKTYQATKDYLIKLGNNENRVVANAAKKAYAEMRNNYVQQFADAGYEGLANKLVDTNRRWKTALDLEDMYFDNVRKVGQLADTDTLSTIQKFGGKTSKDQAIQQDVMQKMQTLDPKRAKEFGQAMSRVASEGLELKGAQEAVPELPNPELSKIQELLRQAKGGQNELSQATGLNVSSPNTIENELLNLLPRKNQQTGSDVSEKKLNQVFDFIKKSKGEDYAKQLSDETDELAKDVAVRNLGRRELEDIPGTKVGIVNKLAGGSASIANKAGRAVKSLQDTPTKLFDMAPEQLQNVASRMAKMGPTGEEYARVLNSMMDRNNVGRSAAIYTLMQQPNFREIYNKLDESENKE